MLKIFNNFRLNQKGIIHLIPLLLLLAGIAGGVYLVQKQGFQIFKPKASVQSIEFSGSCVTTKDGAQVLNCPDVKLKFTSPVEAGEI